jgi:hypothetical protein
MLYQAIISRPELVSLEGLLGNPLDIVVPVVWCAELRTPKAFIRVSPVEVATPDTEHPHGTADRPSITMEMEEASFTNGETGTSLEQLGTVHNVNIISTLVSFSSISMFPERKIAKGVRLPASEGYGFVYYHPSQFEAARAQIADKNALIMFDVGMELVTERFPSIVLYTSGFFVNASFDGLPDQDWGKLGAYVRRPLQRLLARGRDSADPRYVAQMSFLRLRNPVHFRNWPIASFVATQYLEWGTGQHALPWLLPGEGQLPTARRRHRWRNDSPPTKITTETPLPMRWENGAEFLIALHHAADRDHFAFGRDFSGRRGCLPVPAGGGAAQRGIPDYSRDSEPSRR